MLSASKIKQEVSKVEKPAKKVRFAAITPAPSPVSTKTAVSESPEVRLPEIKIMISKRPALKNNRPSTTVSLPQISATALPRLFNESKQIIKTLLEEYPEMKKVNNYEILRQMCSIEPKFFENFDGRYHRYVDIHQGKDPLFIRIEISPHLIEDFHAFMKKIKYKHQYSYPETHRKYREDRFVVNKYYFSYRMMRYGFRHSVKSLDEESLKSTLRL